MNKSHLEYLRRIIGKAISERNRDELTDIILQVKSPNTGVYQMVRDIVCDARFYSVIDDDSFWKTYGAFEISRFVDSVASDEWQSEETLTMRKEEFLNDWMVSHMLPLSRQQRREIEASIQLNMETADGISIPDPEEHDGTSLGIINLGNGIKDTTNKTGEPTDGLPPRLKEYMQDAFGGNSTGLKNDSHQAEARFLANIHPSVVRLAETIGRRGGIKSKKKGKFRHASKSDISGVSTGDDLSSLVPSEIALMATPEAENVFLDRFARKRLQIFSSASRTSEENEKHGPIFICIDTSGSMTGEPEEMAKTLALTISIIAQKERRTVCIFNYSQSISFFVLRTLKTQRKSLLRFLSESYGGGNDENKLMDFIFNRMPKLATYRHFAGELEGADMLVISDFNWIGLDPEKSALLKKARKKGMRIFSVGVEMPEFMQIPGHYLYNDHDDLEEGGYLSGFRFYRVSDYRYRFEDDRLIVSAESKCAFG